MRFYNDQHRHYCGVDLHTKRMYLCILDQEGNKLLHRNVRAKPNDFLTAIEGFRDSADGQGAAENERHRAAGAEEAEQLVPFSGAPRSGNARGYVLGQGRSFRHGSPCLRRRLS